MPDKNPITLQPLTDLLDKKGQLEVRVHVTPKSRDNRIMELAVDNTSEQISIRAKIRGVPENGQVNRNLIVFLAKELHLPPSQCRLTGGFKSHYKIVQIHKHAL